MILKKMKSLRETGLEKKDSMCSWMKIPQVINSCMADSMTIKELLLCEMKFSMVTQEVVQNKELAELITLTRKSINLKQDLLPLFNRRHLVTILQRLKKYSDLMLIDMEKDWYGPGSVCLDPDKIFGYLDRHTNPSFVISCIAYIEMLDELRNLMKRISSEDDISLAYSPRISCERALAPLHRLAAARTTMRRIVIEEKNSKLKERTQLCLDNISGVLDRCYEILTTLHDLNYVADLDNILDFSLKLSSLRYKKSKSEKNLYVPTIEHIKSSLLGVDENLIDFSINNPRKKSYGHFQDSNNFVDIPLNTVDSPVSDNQLLSDSWENSDLYQKSYPEAIMGKFWRALEEEENIYEEIGRIEQPCLRMLWEDIPAVKESGILSILSPAEKALQESKFEIITSEVSYLKSLSVVITLFYNSSELANTLSESEMKSLFANIAEVRDCSEALLYELAGHFDEDIMLRDISRVVRTQAAVNFSPYITYCAAHPNALATLQRLLKHNSKFREVCKRIENYSEVQGCPLQSFLALPAQRVTRFPLLFQAVLGRLSPGSEEYLNIKFAVTALRKLAVTCNESIATQTEEIKPKTTTLKKKTSIKRKSTGLRITEMFTV